MQPHKPIDRNGKTIKIGDIVRIIGVPDLSEMSDLLPIFQYLVGKYKRVRGFDEFGLAEFVFVMHDTNGERVWHSVWIEPYLLHLPLRRSNPTADNEIALHKNQGDNRFDRS